MPWSFTGTYDWEPPPTCGKDTEYDQDLSAALSCCLKPHSALYWWKFDQFLSTLFDYDFKVSLTSCLSPPFFFFPVLQLCKLSDWRRSLHTAGHWKRCPEREQKRHSTALQTFLQNRSSATSNGSFCQNTVQHFADLLSYTELTGNCVVINCALYCPLGGAAGRWASHSFCPELWGEGLPTNQNLYSTGKQNRCSVNTRIQ